MRMFFMVVKQRRQMTYVNSLINGDQRIEGRDRVSEHMANFLKDIRGTKDNTALVKINF